MQNGTKVAAEKHRMHVTLHPGSGRWSFNFAMFTSSPTKSGTLDGLRQRNCSQALTGDLEDKSVRLADRKLGSWRPRSHLIHMIFYLGAAPWSPAPR